MRAFNLFLVTSIVMLCFTWSQCLMILEELAQLSSNFQEMKYIYKYINALNCIKALSTIEWE